MLTAPGRRPQFGAVLAALALMVGAIVVPSATANAAPVPITGKAAVFGVVTPDGAGVAFAGAVSVEILSASSTAVIASDQIDQAGAFEFTAVTPGSYRLRFTYAGTSGWATTWWAPPAANEGDVFSVLAGQVLEANGPLHRAGSIAGTVTAPPGAIFESIKVTVYDAQGHTKATVAVASNGTYSIPNLEPGWYRLSFRDDYGLVKFQYWPDRSTLESATAVSVGFDTTTTVDATMGGNSVVTGIVTYELPGGGTAPLEDAVVTRTSDVTLSTQTFFTDETGRYVVPMDSTPATLHYAGPDEDMSRIWWPGVPMRQQAVLLSAGGDLIKAGYDVTLTSEAVVSGRVRFDTGATGNLANAWVTLFRFNDDAHEYQQYWLEPAATNGTFAFDELPPGDYLVRAAEHPDGLKGLAGEWWEDSPLREDATVLDLVPGETAALGDIVLELPDIQSSRIAGADRFATGVAITKKQFADGDPVPVVYVASGLNYPDALTAGPAAIKKGGALLLVLPDAIPSTVAAELDRLEPEKIIVVGSAASVSDSVKSQLAAYVDSPSDVKRLGGTDRFKTAALVVRDAFPDGAKNAFFATGLNYPDALAAGPAAGQLGAPIILVNGAAGALDAAADDLISDLEVEHAYILGNESAISAGVREDIIELVIPTGYFYIRHINVVAGADRYDTATQVNREVFGDAVDRALIATGAGFADALSGGPYAGALGVPMYLSTPTCVPETVYEGLVRAGVTRATLLGGTGTLSSAVQNMSTC